MKKIFTLIAAAFVAVSVSAQTAKVFTKTEVFLPTKDNLKAAFDAGWMVSGDMTTDTPYSTTSKKANIDPETGETLKSAKSFPGFIVKGSGVKLITIAFKGVKEVTFYAVTTSSDNTRSLKATLTDATGTETVQQASAAPNEGCTVKFSSLSADAEYKVKLEGDEGGKAGDMSVYGIKFDTGSSTGITSVENAVEADAATYNVAGQCVNANAKGIVIKNGKKYINR